MDTVLTQSNIGVFVALILIPPIAFFLLAVLITDLRRQRQLKAKPATHFNRSLLRASYDTCGTMLLVLAVLSFFFSYDGHQLKIGPQYTFWQGILQNKPFYIVIAVGFWLVIAFSVFLIFFIQIVKPRTYRADYEAALRFVRGWLWLPVLKNLIENMDGAILLWAGRYAEAEQRFRVVETRSQKGETKTRGLNQANLGWALIRQNRLKESITILQSSIENYPEGADNFNALGEALLYMGDNSELALKYLTRGIENKRFRMNVDYYVWSELLANQAWAKAQQGRCDMALQIFKQALAEAEQDCIPAMAGLHVRGAEIMRLCGNDAQAIEELNTAMRLDPNGGYGQMAKEKLAQYRKTPKPEIPELAAPGLGQLALNFPAALITHAIEQYTAPRQTEVLRQDSVIVSKGNSYSYIYLLRPQPDNTIMLQVVADRSAVVETALSNNDLKAGLSVLIAEVRRTMTSSTAVLDHLNAIGTLAQQLAETAPTQPPQAAKTNRTETSIADQPMTNPAASTTPPYSSSFDPAAVLARKPLPAVTAKNRPSGEPTPNSIAAMSLVMSPLIGGLRLSCFWRRFGKPTWMWLSMACVILLFVGTLGAIALAARNGLTNLLSTMVVLGTVGANYGFVFSLGSLLEGAYHVWDREGKEGLANYHYKWASAFLRGGLYVFGAMVLGIVIFATRPGPQQFNNGILTLTYPGTWKSDDLSQDTNCSGNITCFLELQDNQFATNIVIGRFKNQVSRVESAASVESTTWQSLISNNPIWDRRGSTNTDEPIGPTSIKSLKEILKIAAMYD